MRIVFFGTANVALPVLEELHKKHQVVGVVTTPDVLVGRKQILEESPVSALAKDLNLPIFKPRDVKSNSQMLAQLKNLEAEVFVVVAYGKILPAEIINLPALKSVNVHFSLLPKYRGPSPIQAALLNGDVLTGSSIFVLDEQVDHGPILAQVECTVDLGDNYFTLSDKLAHVSAKIINPTLLGYALGKLVPLPQDDTAASHSKKITKEDGKVDWNRTASEIYNQFRAYYIWPGIWTVWNDKTLKITDVAVSNDQATPENPGTVLANGIVICGQGSCLQIKSLQIAGKAETEIKSFLNGYPNLVGSKLG